MSFFSSAEACSSCCPNVSVLKQKNMAATDWPQSHGERESKQKRVKLSFAETKKDQSKFQSMKQEKVDLVEEAVEEEEVVEEGEEVVVAELNPPKKQQSLNQVKNLPEKFMFQTFLSNQQGLISKMSLVIVVRLKKSQFLQFTTQADQRVLLLFVLHQSLQFQKLCCLMKHK